MCINKDCTLGMCHYIVVIEEFDWTNRVACLHFKVFTSTLQLEHHIRKLNRQSLPMESLHQQVDKISNHQRFNFIYSLFIECVYQNYVFALESRLHHAR